MNSSPTRHRLAENAGPFFGRGGRGRTGDFYAAVGYHQPAAHGRLRKGGVDPRSRLLLVVQCTFMFFQHLICIGVGFHVQGLRRRRRQCRRGYASAGYIVVLGGRGGYVCWKSEH